MADLNTAALRALLAEYRGLSSYARYLPMDDEVYAALPALLDAAEEAARLRAEREAKKEALVNALKEVDRRSDGDFEGDHVDADDLLVGYINDQDVSDAYRKIGKWYA